MLYIFVCILAKTLRYDIMKTRIDISISYPYICMDLYAYTYMYVDKCIYIHIYVLKYTKIMCTGSRINTAFIPDNFDNVLWAVGIKILSNKVVQICWIWDAIYLTRFVTTMLLCQLAYIDLSGHLLIGTRSFFAVLSTLSSFSLLTW